MNLPQTAADVLRDHVTLECESIDRLYLNVYVPQLQTVGGMVGYLHGCKGQRFASTAAVAPMTEGFLKSVDEFVACSGRCSAVQEGRAQGCGDAGLSGALSGHGGCALHGQGAGEGAGDAHRAAAQSAHGRYLSVDCLLHGNGQPPLLLLCGRNYSPLTSV